MVNITTRSIPKSPSDSIIYKHSKTSNKYDGFLHEEIHTVHSPERNQLFPRSTAVWKFTSFADSSSAACSSSQPVPLPTMKDAPHPSNDRVFPTRNKRKSRSIAIQKQRLRPRSHEDSDRDRIVQTTRKLFERQISGRHKKVRITSRVQIKQMENPQYQFLLIFIELMDQIDLNNQLIYKSPNYALVLDRDSNLRWEQIDFFSMSSQEKFDRMERAYLALLLAIENSLELNFKKIQRITREYINEKEGNREKLIVKYFIQLFDDLLNQSPATKYLLKRSDNLQKRTLNFYWKLLFKKYFNDCNNNIDFLESQKQSFSELTSRIPDFKEIQRYHKFEETMSHFTSQLSHMRDHFMKTLNDCSDEVVKGRVIRLINNQEYGPAVFELGRTISQPLGIRILEIGSFMRNFISSICQHLAIEIPGLSNLLRECIPDKIVDFNKLENLMNRIIGNAPYEPSYSMAASSSSESSNDIVDATYRFRFNFPQTFTTKRFGDKKLSLIKSNAYEGNPNHDFLVTLFKFLNQVDQESHLIYQNPHYFVILDSQDYLTRVHFELPLKNQYVKPMEKTILAVVLAIRSSSTLNFSGMLGTTPPEMDEEGITKQTVMETDYLQLLSNLLHKSPLAKAVLKQSKDLEKSVLELYWESHFLNIYNEGDGLIHFLESKKDILSSISTRTNHGKCLQRINELNNLIVKLTFQLSQLRDHFARCLFRSLDGKVKDENILLYTSHQYDQAVKNVGDPIKLALEHYLLELGNNMRQFLSTACSLEGPRKREYYLTALQKCIPGKMTKLKKLSDLIDKLNRNLPSSPRENYPKKGSRRRHTITTPRQSVKEKEVKNASKRRSYPEKRK